MGKCMSPEALGMWGVDLFPNIGTNLTGVAILGRDAPTKLADEMPPRDFTSTCTPTIPRGYDMVKILDDTVMIPNRRGYDVWKAGKQFGLDGVTPVLSVMYTTDNKTTTQMACMRIVGNPPAEIRGVGSTSIPTMGLVVSVLIGTAGLLL
jgi:hypothetical protein